jgi:dolichyl-phosphate-mannose--protein O-mannosyl transferase
MSTSKYFHIVMPTLFFSAAVVAGVLMEIAIGKNLDNTFRQLLFQQPGPSHSTAVVAWFWTAVTCFVLGVVYAWRAFRHFRKSRCA